MERCFTCRFGPQKVDIRTDLLVAVLWVVFIDPQSVFFGGKETRRCFERME